MIPSQHGVQQLGNRPGDGCGEDHEEAHGASHQRADHEAVLGAHSLGDDLTCTWSSGKGGR